jgi:myo-inositol-1(or 4)-monophosphatase
VNVESGSSLALMENPRLGLALALAREAGRDVIARSGPGRVEWKRPGGRVTDVDQAVQARMVREISSAFPEDGILAEEGQHEQGLDRPYVWAVDPLDGTNNYVLGMPCFTVSVGVLHLGEPYAGVVHDPNTGFTAYALRGHGAFVADRRLGVDGPPGDAWTVAIRAPIHRCLEPVVTEWLAHAKLRVFGSIALHLAYAAFGAIDLVLDDRAALCDIAAGAIILTEAGGVLSDLGGASYFPLDLAGYHGELLPFVAGRPAMHARAVEACRAHVLEGGIPNR